MSDEPTQQEKLEALRNDTNFSWQQNAIDDPGVRFQKLDSDDRDWFSKLVAAAAPGKFALVESRPSGPEPPLGYSVDQMDQK